jgi:hypothetical protein
MNSSCLDEKGKAYLSICVMKSWPQRNSGFMGPSSFVVGFGGGAYGGSDHGGGDHGDSDEGASFDGASHGGGDLAGNHYDDGGDEDNGGSVT